MLSPSKRMSPGVRRVDAGDEVEERRLAGAVRPDHAHDLALVDVQVELVDAREPAEALRDACSSSSRSAIRRSPPARVPSSPCGRAFISTIRITPIRISRVTLGSATSRFSQTNAPR